MHEWRFGRLCCFPNLPLDALRKSSNSLSLLSDVLAQEPCVIISPMGGRCSVSRCRSQGQGASRASGVDRGG